MRSIGIRVRPPTGRPIRSAEAILADPTFPPEHVERIRSCTQHERRSRAEYHARRYLRHLPEEALHRRIGDLLSNSVYVSHRNRYSANTLYTHYWRERLAQTSEELAIRGTITSTPDSVLAHLPPLGFPIPSEVATRGDAPALYRYDKLEYITKLQREGEILLRCASTEDSAGVARNDSNELCISLSLPAEDLIFEGDPLEIKGSPEVVNLQINQKTDYFMFCLSTVYDWRLFGDFADSAEPEDSQEPIACLLIVDPAEFERRFYSAMGELRHHWNLPWNFDLEVISANAIYYDPHDAVECAPLFDNRLQLPLAKRREYTYQHEHRFVIRPHLPDDFVPSYAPAEIPHLQRTFLHLGSLEDISRIIRSDRHPRRESRFYLSKKEIAVLASAMGVTLSCAPQRIRFTYSVECKEKGRTDPLDLTVAKRFSGGSLQLHEQEIDIPVDGGMPSGLQLVAGFYKIFDVREHGNNLISFGMTNGHGSQQCRYEVFLACAEPADEKLEVHRITYHVKFSMRVATGEIEAREETVVVDAEAYWTRFNGVGPLRLHPTYRSLLVAEMEFLDRLATRGLNDLVRYEVFNDEVGRCSEFWSACSPPVSPAPS
jgi:hypothetical protein